MSVKQKDQLMSALADLTIPRESSLSLKFSKSLLRLVSVNRCGFSKKLQGWSQSVQSFNGWSSCSNAFRQLK